MPLTHGLGMADAMLDREMTSLDPEMIEVALLLPRWQAVALQSTAKQQGMSAGQMLRRIIVATVGQQAPLAQVR